MRPHEDASQRRTAFVAVTHNGHTPSGEATKAKTEADGYKSRPTTRQAASTPLTQQFPIAKEPSYDETSRQHAPTFASFSRNVLLDSAVNEDDDTRSDNE